MLFRSISDNVISTSNVVPYSLNYYILVVMGSGGQIGVNCFMLISGYFLVCKSFKTTKVFSIWLETLFYSVLVTVCHTFLGFEKLSFRGVLSTIMPITYRGWWYITMYFAVYIVSPFLNFFLLRLNKKSYISFVFILLCIFSIWPSLTATSNWESNFSWFVVMYIIGAYFRLHGVGILKQKRVLRFGICIWLITVIAMIGIEALGKTYEIFQGHCFYLVGTGSRMPCVICALALFVGFEQLKIKYSPIINSIGKKTLGIYLFHAPLLGYLTMWGIGPTNFIHSPFFVIISFANVVILLGCTILIEIVIGTLVNIISNKISTKRIVKIIDEKMCKIGRAHV